MAKQSNDPGPVTQRTGDHILSAMSAITKDVLEYGGIGKDRWNEQQKFNFRGIEDILRVCSPLLVKHQVVIIPRVVSTEFVTRVGKEDKKTYATYLKVEFDFTSVVDGSVRTVTTVGEGTDFADKGTNKAMSAALKYAMVQALSIPSEVDDADATGEAPQPDADSPITADQLVVLRDLIKELNVPETIPCRVFKVGKLEDLMASQFPAAERKLKSTIAEKNKKAAEGG